MILNGMTILIASKQASKQGITLSFSHVKMKTAQKRKAYSACFRTGGVCLFASSGEKGKIFSHYGYYLVNKNQNLKAKTTLL